MDSVYKTKPRSLTEMKAAITEECQTLNDDKEFCLSVCNSVRQRKESNLNIYCNAAFVFCTYKFYL